jgi:filamentous hemagglutinin family protein
MRNATSLFLIATATAGASPIVHDGSLGPAGNVALSGGSYNILSKNGTRMGGNLFHSFSEFSVPGGNTALFSTDPGTANVIARVTGGNVSQIDGTLAIRRAGVSLYLLNPSGILLGNDAALDISGSFHAIAGDSITFTDGQTFHADPAKAVILTSAPVSSFGFINRSTPAHIAAASYLDSRGDISLVGRTVTLDRADLYAQGSVRIAAVGEGGHAVAVDGFTQNGETSTGRLEILDSTVFSGGAGTGIHLKGGDMEIRSAILNFGSLGFPLPADLTLSSSGSVNIVDGSFLGSISGDTGPANGINLTVAGRLSIIESAVQSFAIGSAPAGDIAISAGDLEISGNGGYKVLGIGSTTFANGRSGNIGVSVAKSLHIENGGTISAVTTDTGSAGNINVAAGALEITGLPVKTEANNDYLTGIFAGSYGSGNGGNIAVAVRDSIQLFRGGLIDSSSFGAGHGGRVLVESPSILADRAGSDFFTGIGSDTEGTGSAGTINVTAKLLDLRNGGLVSAATFGAGQAGDVTVTSRDVIVSGSGKSTPYVVSSGSGIIASTGAGSSGKGGNVTVSASNALTVRNGGQIGAESLGSGNGGSLTVSAASMNLIDGALLSSRSSGPGKAGGILVDAVSLNIAHSNIDVRAAAADAGSLRIDAKGDIVMTGGLITATAGGTGNAGGIRVNSRNFLISGEGAAGGSGVVASTLAGSSGAGGDIEINSSGDLTLETGVRVVAESLGSGDAGDVLLEVSNLFVRVSEISVSAGLASAGSLSIWSAGDIRIKNGRVTASAGVSGGNIVLSARDMIRMDYSTLAAEAIMDGGNVTVSDASYLILNHSRVSANAVNGRGGQILINTGTYFANESQVTASSDFGVQGIVRIDPLVSFSGGEEADVPDLLSADDILQPDCVNRSPETGSSFTKAGRGGTPRLPGGYLPSFRLIE